MAYSVEEINSKFNEIIGFISKDCLPLRKVLKKEGMPSTQTFYKWLDASDTKSKQYARACEDRHDFLFDQILDIADDQEGDIIIIDGKEVTNHNVIQRSRLRVDARKWALSKMNPKKYGDKVDVTSKGNEIKSGVTLTPKEAKIISDNLDGEY